MAAVVTAKSFDAPDTAKEMPGAKAAVCQLGGGRVASRIIASPGWKWSKCIKPIVGTDLCQVDHTGFCVRGSMVVQMKDGTETKVEAGQAYHIPPEHDGWVVGDEEVEVIEFTPEGGWAKDMK